MNKIKIHDKTDMSETDIILHILSNLPDEYEVAVSKIERNSKESSCRLDMDDHRATLSTRYERIIKHEENKKREFEYAFKVCIPKAIQGYISKLW